MALIAEGRVAVSGQAATKPATGVEAGTPVVVRTDPDQPTWVSRGAHKLLGALDAFGVPVEGRRALDAGASTGGFTEVLLRRGAAEVVAVDVGYGELAWALRTDDRVRVHERTNVRTLTPEAIDGPVDLVVADLSFISLRLVLPALVGCAREGADMRAHGQAAVRGRPRAHRRRGSGARPGAPRGRRAGGGPGRRRTRMGDRRGGGEPAARSGWQRGVLPVVAPRRRAATRKTTSAEQYRRGRSERAGA